MIISTYIPFVIYGTSPHQMVDKASRLSISIVIWILSSDNICQPNQFKTNSEAAMLPRIATALFVNWICSGQSHLVPK